MATNLLLTIGCFVDEIVEVRKMHADIYVEIRIAGYPFIVVYDGNFGYYHITNNRMYNYFCTHYGNSQAGKHYDTEFYKGLEEAFSELWGDLEDAGLL